MTDGVDASIPLGVSGGGSGLMQPDSAGGPLAFIGNFAATQQKLTEAKNARQTLAAKQKLGQIMATAPTMEDGLAAAAADPEVSAFVPDVLHTLAATHTSMQEYRGQVQGQTKDAFQSVMSLLPIGAVKGPEALKQAFGAELGNIPDPGVRSTVAKSGGNIINWLTKDLPADPAAAQKEYVSRVTAMGLGTGTGDAMRAIMGQPGTAQLGGTTQPITQQPAIPAQGETPGAVTKVGNALTHTLAPQMTSPDSMPVGPGGGTAAAGGNKLGAPLPKSSTPAPTTDHVAASAPLSGLGTPLFDAKSAAEMRPPADSTRTVGGGPGNPQARDLLDQFSKDERHVYNNANLTRAQLSEMSSDIDTMAKNGGFLVPGTGAEFRVGLSKFAKMIGDVTKTDLGVDADKVASAEDMMKATQRMGITYLNTALGSQREAAETIKNITTKGVPGVNNTYLGSKMLIGMIGALNDRAIDQYNFKTAWANNPRNNSDLRGADQQFNDKFPAKAYIDKALGDLGMTESGFKSRADIDRALAAKLITPAQAEVIRQNRGKIPANLPKEE